MTLPRTTADVLARHVLFEIESIDRLYLNLYDRSAHNIGAATGADPGGAAGRGVAGSRRSLSVGSWWARRSAGGGTAPTLRAMVVCPVPDRSPTGTRARPGRSAGGWSRTSLVASVSAWRAAAA